MSQPIVIVGSGLAAYMLAKEFRKHNQEQSLVMVTKSSGGYYSKPMLSTALTKKQTADDLVMHKAVVMAEQLNATIVTNKEVITVDREKKCILLGDSQQPYSKLVLALGAKPIHLPFAGDAADQLVRVNNIEDYASFRDWLKNKKRIAILGTGLVGCEFMNDLLNSQHQVNMIAPDKTPLAQFLPESLGQAFLQELHQQGVEWNMGVAAERINHCEVGVQVVLSNGSTVNADGVMSAVGLKACVELAAQCGLSVSQGIEVDRYCQSSDPDIFALGDCAQVDGLVLQYVAPLLQSSRALAKTLAGEPTLVNYPPMPVIIKTPACPVVAIPPARGAEGQWEITGSAADMQARFYNQDGQLGGFALMGNQIRQRTELIKKMQPLLV